MNVTFVQNWLWVNTKHIQTCIRSVLILWRVLISSSMKWYFFSHFRMLGIFLYLMLFLTRQSEGLLNTWYKAMEVDSTVHVIETLPTSYSLVECAGHCNIKNSCTVMEFEKLTNSCTSLDRQSLTLSNPSKRVYVDGNFPRKSLQHI